jgi:hypothetical protein
MGGGGGGEFIMHGFDEIWTLKRKLIGFSFQKHLMFCSLWSIFFGPKMLDFPWTPYGPKADPRPPA